MLTKNDFLLRPEVVFLNHGSYGACTHDVLAEQVEWQHKMEQQPVEFFRGLDGFMRVARQSIADYVGAAADDIVFVTNSTFGSNVVIHALCRQLLPGDEVVVNNHEYGACLKAWDYFGSIHGVKIVVADIPVPTTSAEALQIIWAAVTDRTKVMFVSHITSPTGIELPVESLVKKCNEVGIFSFVDGSHGPGHIPLNLDALNADAYTANCHKWMCAPKGSAFLWVNKRSQARIGPLVVSWGWNEESKGKTEFNQNHEFLGTRDCSPFLVIPYVINWMAQNDWPAVQEHSRQLSRDFAEQLHSELGMQNVLSSQEDNRLQMSAVILPPNQYADTIKHDLYNKHNVEVVVQPWHQHYILRLSAHAHTSATDGLNLLKALKAERLS